MKRIHIEGASVAHFRADWWRLLFSRRYNAADVMIDLASSHAELS